MVDSAVTAKLTAKAAEVKPDRVAATAALSVFASLGWVLGILFVAFHSVLTAVGWTAGVTFRAGAFCGLAVHYGFCKGAGIKSVKKSELQPSPPPGPGIPPNTSPGTFPGTFIQ